MYYENQTCSWQPNVQHCPYDKPRDAQAFPPGFRMIAGDTAKRFDRAMKDTLEMLTVAQNV
jgi:hypothetical protein